MVYALLTGRPPYAGRSAAETAAQIRAGVLIKPRRVQPAIPPGVEWLVLRLLARDRVYRFQTAAELLAALDEVTAEHELTV